MSSALLRVTSGELTPSPIWTLAKTEGAAVVMAISTGPLKITVPPAPVKPPASSQRQPTVNVPPVMLTVAPAAMTTSRAVAMPLLMVGIRGALLGIKILSKARGARLTTTVALGAPSLIVQLAALYQSVLTAPVQVSRLWRKAAVFAAVSLKVRRSSASQLTGGLALPVAQAVEVPPATPVVAPL